MSRRSVPFPAIRPGIFLTFGFTALLHLLSTPAEAQTIQGQLLDRRTNTPILGALVLLLNESGEEENGFLSNAEGRFLLKGKGPGTFTVRAERIGYETTISEPIHLSEDETFQLRIEVLPAPIALSELEIEGERVCQIRPEDGLGVSRVWEEARKALAAQEWAERERLHRFTVTFFENLLERSGDQIRSESWEEEGLFERVPFRSLPVENLHKDGYIQQPNIFSTEYYAPDAGVLLSDLFLDTHCFRLSEDRDNPGLIGVAFEPVKKRRATDIEGVLWVDRESAQLRYLEFRYTPISWRRRKLSGGKVEFHQLPSGAWIVRRWSIRMPTRVGYKEYGAEIIRIEEIQTT